MIRVPLRFVAATLALAGLPLAAFAVQTVRSPVRAATTHAVSPQGFHPRKRGPHTFYGTIVSLNGTQLVLKRRNGRLQNIDASVAIADNAYSQPLFVGKVVVIDGSVSGGIFTAAHIYRLTDLDDLGNDI